MSNDASSGRSMWNHPHQIKLQLLVAVKIDSSRRFSGRIANTENAKTASKCVLIWGRCCCSWSPPYSSWPWRSGQSAPSCRCPEACCRNGTDRSMEVGQRNFLLILIYCEMTILLIWQFNRHHLLAYEFLPKRALKNVNNK